MYGVAKNCDTLSWEPNVDCGLNIDTSVVQLSIATHNVSGHSNLYPA